MTGKPLAISADQLYSQLGTAAAPLLIDARPNQTFDADDRLIVGAARRLPEQIADWQRNMAKGRRVIAYGVDGSDASQDVARTLQSGGIDAAYLEGGIESWKERRLPTRRKRGAAENKWVTREHPKIDRVACPWLVSRFVNPDAEFIYVPPNDVAKVAREVGGTPYDIKDAEFGHVGDRCSFDAVVRIYDVHDPALDHLATIVRGADTSRPDLAPQCEGLLAIIYGMSANFPDDHDMLRQGMVIYDALYTWCRLQVEKQRPR